jgi:GNAT superfamily N-acetyltransferase
MVEIRPLQHNDIALIANAFAEIGWNKPASQYQGYLSEQESGRRLMLIATIKGTFAGYLTIVWESSYPPFRESGIPEIVDFNVLPKFQRQGIGTQLMDAAEEKIAARSSIAGIGVGMTRDYSAAHVLYIKRGYLPDGQGIISNESFCQYGDQVIVDDGLKICFTKQLAIHNISGNNSAHG